jgi:hypothetical protein
VYLERNFIYRVEERVSLTSSLDNSGAIKMKRSNVKFNIKIILSPQHFKRFRLGVFQCPTLKFCLILKQHRHVELVRDVIGTEIKFRRVQGISV